MAEPTEPVVDALADVPIADRPCLEAGAGVGNATAGLRDAGGAPVFGISNEAEHVRDLREAFRGDDAVVPLLADLRRIPLADDAVEVATAHCLFNVLAPAEASPVVAELTRVVAPGGWLVVDDYAPLPDGPVRDLFALENAVGTLAESSRPYTFYPPAHLRSLFEARGWELARERTLLDPVPWSDELLDAHADLVEAGVADLPADLAEALRDRLTAVGERAAGGVDAGELYSLAFRRVE